MYRFWRHSRVQGDQGPQAVQFAKEVADYLTAKYPEHPVQAYGGYFGDLGSVYWFSDYKDLAAFESFVAQLNADKDYLALLDKGNRLFSEGHDTLVGPFSLA